MYKVGLSSGEKIREEQFFIDCQKNNIDCIEIAPNIDYESYMSLDYKLIKKYADKYGITLWSHHLRFNYPHVLDISSLDKDVLNCTIGELSEQIKKASDIGVGKFVIHPSSEPIEDVERKDKLERAKETLDKLAELSYYCGGVLAVENLPRTCLGKSFEEMLELVSINDKLGICFDTNHLLGEDPVKFIQNVGYRIVTLHVSDYDFVNERHWLPGEGDINWVDIYDELQKVNYKGVWLYEIGFKCPKTIIRPRDLTCYDFRRNADEIFSKSPLTTIATRKENLGMWE